MKSWIGLSIGGVGMYSAGIGALAGWLGEAWNSVEVLDPTRHSGGALWTAFAVVTVLAAWFVIVILPGWPWAKLFLEVDTPAKFLGATVACSLIGQIVVGTLFKVVGGVELTRLSYLVLLTGVALSGLAAGRWRAERAWGSTPSPKAFLPGLTLGLTFCAGIVLILGGKVFVEAMDGDGTEAFELARSLTSSTVPWFDLENGSNEFGWTLTQPPGLAYLHLPFLLLLGANEVSVRLLYLLCYVFVVPLLVAIAAGRQTSRGSSWWIVAISSLAAVCMVENSMFHSGWSVVYSDFAKCGEIVLVTAALASVFFLRRDRLVLAVFFAVLAAAVRWYGGFLMVIVFASFALVEGRRRWMSLMHLLFALASLGVLLLLAGHASGNLEVWKMQFGGEHSWMLTEEPAISRDPGAVLFHFVLYTGLLGPVVLFFPRLGQLGRSLSLSTVAFLIFLSRSSLVLGHFYLPIVPLPALIAGSELAQSSRTKRARLVGVLTIALQLCAVYFLWPRSLVVNTFARDFGVATCFETENYQEAVGLSHVLDEVEEELSFKPSPHAWVFYAMRRPPDRPCHVRVLPKEEVSEERHLELARSGLSLVATNDSAALYMHRRETAAFRDQRLTLKRDLYRTPLIRPYVSLPPAKSRELFGREDGYRRN